MGSVSDRYIQLVGSFFLSFVRIIWVITSPSHLLLKCNNAGPWEKTNIYMG